MDRMCEALDEAKAEIEKLKAEYRIKAELSEKIKRSYNEQLIKIQELGLKIEKQAQELDGKEEEITMTKQMIEDLKGNLNEKETIIKHLSSANNMLRINCDEKSRKWEEQNNQLVLALDEANEKNRVQEQKIRAFKDEIEILKEGLLSVSQKKCMKAERKAKEPNELRQRDDLLSKLEEENRKFEDQLKWKKEQFKHLEEAHEKLRDQFQVSKKEWEIQNSRLLDEICSLQTSLDSQTRLSKDLQSQLQRCNQALAHEESRRKYIEVQLSESKTCFENAFTECQKTKSKIECLTHQRDSEIAALRYSLDKKQALCKEMEYQSGKLEQENKELRSSLKELQEARIHEAGSASSLGKLRNRLRSLEQTHRECSINLKTKEAEWSLQLEKMCGDLNDCRSELKSKDTDIKKLKLGLECLEQIHKYCSQNLKAKEAEWSSQLEKITQDLNHCRFELESKDTVITKLKMELEGCHSLIMQLKLQNEETSLMLLVLKLGFVDAKSEIDNQSAIIDMRDKKREEKIYSLVKQLEMKNTALVKAKADTEEEREKAAMLCKKVESLALIEQQKHLIQKELERHKEMLVESSEYQLHLKEQAMEMEREFIERLGEVCDALDRANCELAEKTSEGCEVGFELQMWKTFAERLQVELEENHEMRRELEASLLAQVEVEETYKKEKDGLVLMLEEKKRRISNLQQQIVLLDKELKTRESNTASFARTESEKEKDKRIDDLQQLVRSLELNFNSSVLSFSCQLVEKQAEIKLVQEACEKITTAEILAKLEIAEQKLIIADLEDEIHCIQKKLDLHEKSLSHSKQQTFEIEAELEAKQLEVKKLSFELETKMRSSDALLGFIGRLSDRMNNFSSEDMQLMGTLGKIVQTFDNNEFKVCLTEDKESDSMTMQENANTYFSPTIKKSRAINDDRSPFRELNS